MNLKIILSFIAITSIQTVAHAQLSVGANGIYFTAGSKSVLQNLVFQPSSDISIKSNTLTLSQTSIPGTPTSSIERVYKWTDTIRTQGVLGIYVAPAEMNGNLPNRLKLAFNATTNPNNFTPSTTSVFNASDHLVSDSIGSRAWRQLTAVQSGSALPLQLLNFAGHKSESSSLLYWVVASELGVSRYQLFRSDNARTWSLISSVAPSCTNCAEQAEYQVIDPTPQSGANFYRLKIETEGTFHYSKIVQIDFPMVSELKLSPNPFSNQLLITGLQPNNEYSFEVKASDGRLLLGKIIPNATSQFSIDASSWPAGVYFFYLNSGKQQVLKQKLTKL